VAGPGEAQGFEYVITFDNVVVDSIDANPESPGIAHLDLPGMARPAASAETEADRSKQGERPKPLDPLAEPSPRVIRRSPDALPSLAVPSGANNPSFVQAGFVVEAFWAVRTGTPDAYMKSAHFHPPDLSKGFEAQHLGHPNELHGIMIRSLDGTRFGLKSLRYRVTRNRQLPNKPLSIEGFSNYNVNVLVARSYDPRTPIRTQFVSFPVGLPVGNDLTLPWWTLRIFGFELVDQVYIASSASVDFDDVVLTRSEPSPGPTGRREEDR
jgi:hypothetical protein